MLCCRVRHPSSDNVGRPWSPSGDPVGLWHRVAGLDCTLLGIASQTSRGLVCCHLVGVDCALAVSTLGGDATKSLGKDERTALISGVRAGDRAVGARDELRMARERRPLGGRLSPSPLASNAAWTELAAFGTSAMSFPFDRVELTIHQPSVSIVIIGGLDLFLFLL